MVITHHADSTRALFDMTKRFHEHCPEILKPPHQISSRRELSLMSSTAATWWRQLVAIAWAAGNADPRAHCRDGFWPKSTANDIWNGLIQAVPNTRGTAVFVKAPRMV